MTEGALDQYLRRLFEAGFRAEFEAIQNSIEIKNEASEALISVHTVESVTAAKLLNDESLALLNSLKSGSKNFEELMQNHFPE